MKKSEGPALIIGFGKKKKDDAPDDEGSAEEEAAESPDEEASEDGELTMHAEALADAVIAGDRAGIVEAVKKCFLAHEGGGYDGGTEDDSE